MDTVWQTAFHRTAERSSAPRSNTRYFEGKEQYRRLFANFLTCFLSIICLFFFFFVSEIYTFSMYVYHALYYPLIWKEGVRGGKEGLALGVWFRLIVFDGVLYAIG